MSGQPGDELAALPEQARWAIERADGFLDLRLPERARAELDRVEPPATETLPFRQTCLRLAMTTGAWTDASALAGLLRMARPDKVEFWVTLAYATRRAEGIEPARAVLVEALDRFPAEAVIPFNLACYACQIGDLPGARRLLARVFRLSPAFLPVAREDPDLEALWDELPDHAPPFGGS